MLHSSLDLPKLTTKLSPLNLYHSLRTHLLHSCLWIQSWLNNLNWTFDGLKPDRNWHMYRDMSQNILNLLPIWLDCCFTCSCFRAGTFSGKDLISTKDGGRVQKLFHQTLTIVTMLCSANILANNGCTGDFNKCWVILQMKPVRAMYLYYRRFDMEADEELALKAQTPIDTPGPVLIIKPGCSKIISLPCQLLLFC